MFELKNHTQYRIILSWWNQMPIYFVTYFIDFFSFSFQPLRHLILENKHIAQYINFTSGIDFLIHNLLYFNQNHVLVRVYNLMDILLIIIWSKLYITHNHYKKSHCYKQNKIVSVAFSVSENYSYWS